MMKKFQLFLFSLNAILFSCISSASPDFPNIIIISVDALRPDYMSCYGYGCATTPNIDSVAEKGIMFFDANTSIPLTNPSIITLFTSRLPYQTGVRRNGMPLPEGNETLIEILRNHNYTTAAVPGCWALNKSRSGLADNFDYYSDQYANLMVAITAGMVTQRALRLINSGISEPFLLWLHYPDMHQPHLLHPAHTVKNCGAEKQGSIFVIKCYESEIAYTDRQIGKLLMGLEEKNLLERSLVIIMADHGESLGEKNYVGHGRKLYNNVIRIPLILSGPSIPEGKKIQQPVRILDIAPTILAYLDIEKGEGMEGRNLMPMIEEEHPTESFHIYFETNSVAVVNLPILKNLLADPSPVAVGLRVDNIKITYQFKKNKWELYDLDEDPKELNNLFATEEHQSQILAEELLEWYKKRNQKEKEKAYQ